MPGGLNPLAADKDRHTHPPTLPVSEGTRREGQSHAHSWQAELTKEFRHVLGTAELDIRQTDRITV